MIGRVCELRVRFKVKFNILRIYRAQDPNYCFKRIKSQNEFVQI